MCAHHPCPCFSFFLLAVVVVQVVKQLKLIHKKPVSAKELKVVGNSLHQNVVDCMRSLCLAARGFGYTEFSPEEVKTEELLNAHDESERISPELGERIISLFHSNIIQKTFDRRAEFWLLDSFPYYVKVRSWRCSRTCLCRLLTSPTPAHPTCRAPHTPLDAMTAGHRH